MKFILGPPTDPLRASVTNQEQRAFIKIHLLLGDTPAQIYRLLHKSLKAFHFRNRKFKEFITSFHVEIVNHVINNLAKGDQELPPIGP